MTNWVDDYGNVSTMTNNFGNVQSDTVFSYTYTATNQLDTITAPGSRVWDFTYNALGQVTQYTHPTDPSGLVTQYTYDARNRLSSIMHKDGETVLLPFEYELDDVGNITKIEEKNGFYWDYGYDGRYRLVSAKFHDGTKTRWNESYTYDGGDNMLTKNQPWFDTFEDGVYSGWGVWAGTWTAADGYLKNTSAGAGSIIRGNTRTDYEEWFSYYRDSSSGVGETVIGLKYDTNSQYLDQLRLRIHPDWMMLDQKYSNSWTTLDTELAADTTSDTWYDVYVKCDGANVEVWRGESGEAMTQVLNTASASTMNSTVTTLWMTGGTYWRFDDFAMLDADGEPIMSYTYTVNDANELTAMSDGTTTTNFTYDAWGRQTSKYTTSYDADYEYRYSQKLASVTSNFPGEGAVDYLYGGDGKRRARTAGEDETWYNWDGQYALLAVEAANTGDGELISTVYAAKPSGCRSIYLGIAAGESPSTAPPAYLLHDGKSAVRGYSVITASISGFATFGPSRDLILLHGTDANQLVSHTDWPRDLRTSRFTGFQTASRLRRNRTVLLGPWNSPLRSVSLASRSPSLASRSTTCQTCPFPMVCLGGVPPKGNCDWRSDEFDMTHQDVFEDYCDKCCNSELPARRMSK